MGGSQSQIHAFHRPATASGARGNHGQILRLDQRSLCAAQLSPTRALACRLENQHRLKKTICAFSVALGDLSNKR